MCSQMVCTRRGIVTMIAFVRLFSTVRFQMWPQIACMRRGKVTLVAFVWLFSAVYFKMTSQAAFHRGCILTLVALVWFFSFFICVSQGNIYIGPTFTKFNIYKMLTHHHQGGNVVPCVMSLSKLFKPIEAQYCSSKFPIWTENKLLNWSEWQQYTFTFNIKIWVNGNELPLSQWELFNKLDRPPPVKTLLCIKGPYNFLKFSGLALAQGWLDFHPSILGADGGKSNQPLVEFPSTGWISI